MRDVDPAEMLGVYRRQFESDGVRYLELTQPGYVEELCRKFADHLPSKCGRCPIPEGTVLGLKEEGYTPELAEQTEFRELGYLSATGSVLWAARQCYVECIYVRVLSTMLSHEQAVCPSI